MRLTLTVRDLTGAATDLRLRLPDTTAAGWLAAQLSAAVNAAADAPLCCAGRVLPRDGRAIDWGLTYGCLVTVGHLPVEPAAAELLTLRGPDTARRWLLPPGEHLIGSGDCPVRIADAALSPRHAQLRVSPERLEIADLESTNGTTVGTRPVRPGRAVPLVAGSTLHVGDSELLVTRPGAGIPAPDSGRLPDIPDPEVRFPAAPAPPPPVRLPLVAAVTPLLVGAGLAWLLHEWQFLAFTALSPVMALAQWLSDRRSRRVAAGRAQREFGAATAAAEQRLGVLLAAEREHRHREFPVIGVLLSTDPEPAAGLAVRLGLGDLPSVIKVVGDTEQPLLREVPVSAALGEPGRFGVVGPLPVARGLVRSLLLQAAAGSDPGRLGIVVLGAAAPSDWHWARWLPHTTPGRGEACRRLLGLDAEQVAARVRELRELPAAGPQRRTLLVVDCPEPVVRATGLREFAANPPPGVTVLWLAGTERRLPPGCATVVTLSAASPYRLTVRCSGASAVDDVAPDLVGAPAADVAARRLAGARGSTAAPRIPTTVRWSSLVGLDLRDPAKAGKELADRWSTTAALAPAVGATADRPVSLDLRRDGPHALVAGTTGAGKSELLRTLVASLAAANRPDRLALLLVDYKGGAAFGPCAHLPHVAGLVTDLDPSSTARALVSLRAELRRRERALAAVGAADIDTYDEAATPDLPRLVIVVDEFATLAEDLPEFVSGLVAIAQRGRSLGVHLVLATQRPQGAVSADIRANTRLRVCLGVAREEESRDVLDGPQAAGISRTTPGRAYLRAGPGECTLFQVARLGGSPEPAAAVTRCPVELLGDPPAPSPVASPVDEVDALLVAVAEAARHCGAAAATAPWLPPLPDRIDLATLPASDPTSAPWGVLDVPDRQRQPAFTTRVDRPAGLLVVGAPRSGRTTAIRTLITSLALRRGPDRLHLWAIDGGGGLADLVGLPHCGAVVPAYDEERVERLVAHLAELVAARRHGGGQQPQLVLAVDPWDAVVEASARHDGGRTADELLRLAADGPGAGLRLLVTSGGAGLTGRLAASVPDKVVLPLADTSDYAMLGVPLRQAPEHRYPGRGLVIPGATALQVATGDAATLRRAAGWPAPASPPRRFEPLPDRVALPRCDGTLVLGVRADDLRPVGIAAAAAGTFLVAGPPRSGRSTALAVLAGQLTDRPVVALCGAASPLREHPAVVPLDYADESGSLAALERLAADGARPPHLLLDDVDLLDDGPLAGELTRAVRAARAGRRLVALAGTTDVLGAAFRGPVPEARRARRGLLLRPQGRHDGDLLGVRLTRAHPGDPPGRGWLALDGRATRVQLAAAAG